MAQLKLPRLQVGFRICDPETGNVSPEFLLFWQTFAEAIEANVNDINFALEAAGIALDAADAANTAAAAANTAASTAQGAADSTAQETSLVNSFVTGFTAPLISGSSIGTITIANHTRQYGDTALNPSVAVTGGTILTGLVSPALVRVYYDDPTRAGGAVTYQYTVDPADPPIQGGDRHSVGAVTIPAVGSTDGGYIRPPGYTGDIP